MTRDTPLFDVDAGPPSEIEAVAIAQLDRLTAAGVLTDDHEILKASILALARSMGISARRGQSVALAHASKELREWYLLIPGTPDPDDPFSQVIREAEKARSR